MSNYTVHPAAELFPMMGGEELRELADDIKANGLIEPVAIYEEQILDGRNRLAACELAGVAPRFEAASLNGHSPTLWAIAKNVHRRHLTIQQRAAIAADMVPLIKAEQTLVKQREAARRGNETKHGKSSVPANLPEPTKSNPDNKIMGEARHIAGRAMQIGGRTVQTALHVKKEDPEEFERVKRGETTLGAAVRKVRAAAPRPAPAPAPSKATGKREQMLEKAARDRVISILSQMRGMTSGLTEFDPARLARAFGPDGLKVWRATANEIAGRLREFARMLGSKEAA